MKKIYTLLLLSFSLFSFGQAKYYKEIKSKNINKDREQIARNFSEELFKKCQNKDYSAFIGFTLAKSLEVYIEKNMKVMCDVSDKKNGDIKILGLNSAYISKAFENFDPRDLYIYDLQGTKSSEKLYLKIWLYHDQNVIGGIVLNKEKFDTPKTKQK